MLMHVLGAVSLLVLVAVSTMVRAGIGLDHMAGVAGNQIAEPPPESIVEPEVSPETALDPAAISAPMHFGPLLDRMRP